MRPNNRSFAGVDGFAQLLRKAAVDFGVEDIADALWLAAFISGPAELSSQRAAEESAAKSGPNVREETLEPALPDDDMGAQLTLPSAQSNQSGADQKPEGISIKAPAAPALRIRLDLARAMRPLRRMVPSPGQMMFDEAATVEQIADQQIWSPVMCPAPERWLDVALVVEETRALTVWQETIAEVQTLLERQGAFRRVTTWRLTAAPDGELALFPNWRRQTIKQRPRLAKELWDPTQRRLILLLSDCTSEAWRNGAIASWLQIWGKRAPMAVMQLLPERLWSQSGLGLGVPVLLKSIEPGCVNERLTVKYQMPLYAQLIAAVAPEQRLKVPVVTLQAEPLKQWAKMVAGGGESLSLGVVFDGERGRGKGEGEPGEGVSAGERVQRFWTTASLMAQELAGLMSAAPVSPPIVDLIRQVLLPKAEPVHVAEVYMGGLMEPSEPDAKGRVAYDFDPEVRKLLSDAVPRSMSKTVLNEVSIYISKRLGLNTRSFEALLRIDFGGDAEAQGLVVPFAKIATQTLRRMGREYAAIAERIQTGPKVAVDQVIAASTDWMPLLQTFTFREATVSFEGVADPDKEKAAELKTFDFESAVVTVPSAEIESVKFADAYRFLEDKLATQAVPQTLTPSTREILQAAWYGNSYAKLSRSTQKNEDTLKREGRQLWALLSSILDVELTKATVRRVLTQCFMLEHSSLVITRRQRGQQLVDYLNSDISLEMVSIKGGTFIMGSPKSEERRNNSEGPQHEVTLPSFFMGKYPITQAQWRAVAALSQVNRELDLDPARFKGDNRPVEQAGQTHTILHDCEANA